jgi:hypothetical protein
MAIIGGWCFLLFTGKKCVLSMYLVFSILFFIFKFFSLVRIDRLLAEIHILYGLIHLQWLEYTDILILKQVSQNLNALVVIYGIKLSLYI